MIQNDPKKTRKKSQNYLKRHNTVIWNCSVSLLLWVVGSFVCVPRAPWSHNPSKSSLTTTRFVLRSGYCKSVQGLDAVRSSAIKKKKKNMFWLHAFNLKVVLWRFAYICVFPVTLRVFYLVLRHHTAPCRDIISHTLVCECTTHLNRRLFYENTQVSRWQ